MREFVRVIVEQEAEKLWSAWFQVLPEEKCNGECPADAIFRLVQLFGADEFDFDEATTVEELNGVGHLEFTIPLRRLKRLPRPSAN